MTIHQQLALWVPFAVVFPLLFFTIRGASGWCWITYSTQQRGLYPVPPKKTVSPSSSDNESQPSAHAPEPVAVLDNFHRHLIVAS